MCAAAAAACYCRAAAPPPTADDAAAGSQLPTQPDGDAAADADGDGMLMMTQQDGSQIGTQVGWGWGTANCIMTAHNTTLIVFLA
jgi:hypothetical protein